MNKVEVVYINDVSQYKDDVWELLCEADEEFVPHLSSREYESSINVKDNKPGPVKYFEEIKNDLFLIVNVDGKFAGFLSYREKENLDELSDYHDFIYISTVIIKKGYRSNKLAQALYKHLIDYNKGRQIITRTWSSNLVQIQIFKNLKFIEIMRIKDHRGPGIDSMYVLKE